MLARLIRTWRAIGRAYVRWVLPAQLFELAKLVKDSGYQFPRRCKSATATLFRGNISEKLLAFSVKATRFPHMQSAFCG
jgi:hypothetical protein